MPSGARTLRHLNEDYDDDNSNNDDDDDDDDGGGGGGGGGDDDNDDDDDKGFSRFRHCPQTNCYATVVATVSF